MPPDRPLLRRLTDPKGGDPKKIVERLRTAGYELIYVDGVDDPALAFVD